MDVCFQAVWQIMLSIQINSQNKPNNKIYKNIQFKGINLVTLAFGIKTLKGHIGIETGRTRITGVSTDQSS